MWIALALAALLLSAAGLWMVLRRRPDPPLPRSTSCLSMRDTLERRVRDGDLVL